MNCTRSILNVAFLVIKFFDIHKLMNGMFHFPVRGVGVCLFLFKTESDRREVGRLGGGLFCSISLIGNYENWKGFRGDLGRQPLYQ